MVFCALIKNIVQHKSRKRCWTKQWDRLPNSLCEWTPCNVEVIHSITVKRELSSESKTSDFHNFYFFFAFFEDDSQMSLLIQNRQTKDTCCIYSEYTSHSILCFAVELPIRNCGRGKPHIWRVSLSLHIRYVKTTSGQEAPRLTGLVSWGFYCSPFACSLQFRDRH